MKYRMFFGLIALVLLTAACGGPKSEYTFVEEKGIGRIPVGTIDRKVLEKEPYRTWFEKNYENYRPDPQIIAQIKNLSPRLYTVEIYMGTWCPDSREHVPHFLKIADKAGFKRKQIRIVALPRHYKQHELVAGKNIIRIPTFIIYKDGRELGRIIEYPMQSLEKDLWQIMAGQDYIHDYQREP